MKHEPPEPSQQVLLLAHREAQATGRALTHQLEDMLGCTESDALAVLGQHFGFATTDAIEMRQWKAAFDVWPLTQAQQKHCVVFRHGAGPDWVAVLPDPFNLDLQLKLENIGAPMEFRLATVSDIDACLSTHEDQVRAMDSIASLDTKDLSSNSEVETISLQAISADTSPIVRIVNSTLYDALKAGASDIHLESMASGMVVRYRIDGVLSHASTHEGAITAEQVISRLKVLAELDIAEHRVPQDGRFKIAALGREIDLRVSIMPSIHGEDAVLRVLDKHTIVPPGQVLSLELLGFEAQALRAIRQLAAQPYGMLLVTGPTGSGKTTTLYAAISEMDLARDKVVTIEDPVEYELPGVLQIPVNDKKGLTFARGLRSILRHDPDKIMVGESRDAETAEIAVQSALTGHLVLTTVHANNVFDVFSRFTHMGIDPFALTSALNGIWAQRLIRTICPRCRQPHEPPDDLLVSMHISGSERQGVRFYRGLGCGECRGTGFKGRKAIAEILTLNDPLREMLALKAPISEIKKQAQSTGTQFLRDAAWELVRQGLTTVEEMGRVTLH